MRESKVKKELQEDSVMVRNIRELEETDKMVIEKFFRSCWFYQYIFLIEMQNRKLFEAIEKMVEAKNFELKNIKVKENFALDYCHQQLLKKKLIPKDPRIKMNKIMKNFQQLDTFINVDQLISCLNDIFRDEKKNETQNIL